MATNKTACTCDQQLHREDNLELIFIAPASENWGIGLGHLSRSLKLIKAIQDSSSLPRPIYFTLVTQNNSLSNKILANYKVKINSLRYEILNHNEFNDGFSFSSILNKISSSKILIVDSPYKISGLDNLTEENLSAVLTIETKQDINIRPFSHYSLNKKDYKNSIDWIRHLPFDKCPFEKGLLNSPSKNYLFDLLVFAGGGHDPSFQAREIIESAIKSDLKIATRLNQDILEQFSDDNIINLGFVNDISNLFSKTKVVVTSGGLTLLEAYSSGSDILSFSTNAKEQIIIKEMSAIDDRISIWQKGFDIKKMIDSFDTRLDYQDSRLELYGFSKIINTLYQLIDSI